MEKEWNIEKEDTKSRDLLLGLLFDGIGMLSFSIPFLGEFSDVVWAPISGFLMMWMYKGSLGKIAGSLSFLEEIIPFTDVIPTFTLTWIYNYYLKSASSKY